MKRKADVESQMVRVDRAVRDRLDAFRRDLEDYANRYPEYAERFDLDTPLSLSDAIKNLLDRIINRRIQTSCLNRKRIAARAKAREAAKADMAKEAQGCPQEPSIPEHELYFAVLSDGTTRTGRVYRDASCTGG